MNVDALPVPKLQNAMDPVHIRTVSKILGVALVAQWVLPWMKIGTTLMSWDIMKLAGFMAIWPLLAGGALLAFGFVKPGVIKRGVMVAAGAGIGVLGIFSVASGFSIFPFTYTFGFLGIATLAFGLLMWIRQGHSQVTWIVTIVGASMMLLGLLIPVGGFGPMGGSEMPLIALFKVFGGGGGFILGSIFFFLFGLVYIAIIAGTVMFVILPQAAATEGWIKLLFNVLMVFFPVAFIVTFLFMFTNGMPLYGLHMAVLTGAYLWLTISCGMSVFEAIKDGSIKSWF